MEHLGFCLVGGDPDWDPDRYMYLMIKRLSITDPLYFIMYSNN
jgi:hypothetical protein